MNKTKHALYAYFAHKQHTYCEWSEWKALRNVESVRDSNGWSERVINASADNFKHYSPINGCFARTRITNGRKKNCSRPEAYPFCSVIHTPNTFPFHIHTNSIQSRVIKIRQSRIFLMAKAYNVCLRVCVVWTSCASDGFFFSHIHIFCMNEILLFAVDNNFPIFPIREAKQMNLRYHSNSLDALPLPYRMFRLIRLACVSVIWQHDNGTKKTHWIEISNGALSYRHSGCKKRKIWKMIVRE